MEYNGRAKYNYWIYFFRQVICVEINDSYFIFMCFKFFIKSRKVNKKSCASSSIIWRKPFHGNVRADDWQGSDVWRGPWSIDNTVAVGVKIKIFGAEKLATLYPPRPECYVYCPKPLFTQRHTRNLFNNLSTL